MREENHHDSKKKIVRFSLEKIKYYKSIQFSMNERKQHQRRNSKLEMIRVNNYHENTIYVSSQVSMKRKQLYNINRRINIALKILGEETKPDIFIISQKEMHTNAIASYDFVNSIIFLTPNLGGNKYEVYKYTQYFARSEEPISTILHELIHWKDADQYKKRNGAITVNNMMEYFNYCENKAIKELEMYHIDDYNVSNISRYALDLYKIKDFDEVLVEYKVKIMLKRKGIYNDGTLY